MRHPTRLALRIAALASLSLCAAAQIPHPEPGFTPEEIWFRSVTVHGFAEGSYTYNFNHPDSELNTLRVFDFRERVIKLDVFELVAERPIEKPGEIGFRFDAEYGQSIPRVSAASGLFRDVSTGKAKEYDLQQGYVSWIAPLGKGLRIDAGKFVTPFGYEVIEGYDGYNDNQSRSFLFGFAIPFTHTGLRASYTFAEQVSASLYAVEGWDDFHDNNDGQSFGAQLALKPVRDWSIALTAMTGPEQKDDVADNRTLYGLTSTWKASEQLTLGAEGVYGQEENLTASGGDATWSGEAAYLRWDFSETSGIALRGEIFDDGDGVRTGTAQKLKSFTLTPQKKLSKEMILRGDLRQDWSDESVFEDGSGTSKDQLTVSIALIIAI